MEATKKVVSQIETILCQKMAEATGKPAHEFSLSVEKREELKKQSAGAESQIEPVLEDVQKKLIQFYEEDQENRAVFTIYVDRKKDVISGEVMGKNKLLVVGLSNCIANNKDIRRIFADASYIAATKSLAELVDILSTDKEKDHE